MVKIGNKPIIEHIMGHYLKYGFSEFILATGYKSLIFKNILKILKILQLHLIIRLIKKNAQLEL